VSRQARHDEVPLIESNDKAGQRDCSPSGESVLPVDHYHQAPARTSSIVTVRVLT
jgi:hypothetical protein